MDKIYMLIIASTATQRRRKTSLHTEYLHALASQITSVEPLQSRRKVNANLSWYGEIFTTSLSLTW